MTFFPLPPPYLSNSSPYIRGGEINDINAKSPVMTGDINDIGANAINNVINIK